MVKPIVSGKTASNGWCITSRIPAVGAKERCSLSIELNNTWSPEWFQKTTWVLSFCCKFSLEIYRLVHQPSMSWVVEPSLCDWRKNSFHWSGSGSTGWNSLNWMSSHSEMRTGFSSAIRYLSHMTVLKTQASNKSSFVNPNEYFIESLILAVK